MSNRFALSSGLGIALAIVLFVPTFVAAQGLSGAAKTAAKTDIKAWTTPHTPDGKPDLHGYWTSESFTPLERPAKYAGREFLTDEEVEAAQKAGLQRAYDRTSDDPEETLSNLSTFGLTAALEGFAPNKRTSLIVDPPDGRMPPRTPEALKRSDPAPTVMTAKRTKRGNRKRRGAPRYRLALPVLVRTGPQRRAETIAGRTHDISSQGVYFAFNQELAPGSRFDFTLALPAEITQGTEILIRARGRVVRAEKKKKNGAGRVISFTSRSRTEPAPETIRGECFTLCRDSGGTDPARLSGPAYDD